MKYVLCHFKKNKKEIKLSLQILKSQKLLVLKTPPNLNSPPSQTQQVP